MRRWVLIGVSVLVFGISGQSRSGTTEPSPSGLHEWPRADSSHLKAKEPPRANMRRSVVDPALAERMQTGEGRLPVFIVLRSQPQAEVLERYETSAGARLKSLEASYRQAATEPAPVPARVELAREQWQREMFEVRRAAFREIRSLIDEEQTALEQLILRLGGTYVRRYAAINMLAAEVPASAIETLAAEPAVAEINLVEQRSPQLHVSVPSLGAPTFWSAGYTGSGESVAVLDTGARTSHPAFAGLHMVNRVFLDSGRWNRCFADDATSPEDRQGHGTHVAGIVAGRALPYLGVARGLGTLYNLKISHRGTSDPNTGACNPSLAVADDRDVLAALDWALQNAPWIKIFNFSHGKKATSDDEPLARMFDYLADRYNLTLTVAAGNASEALLWGLLKVPGAITSPAIGYNVISVGAVNTQGTIDRRDDTAAGFSSMGPTRGGRKKPDLAAPGGVRDGLLGPDGGILSADYASNGYKASSGTSMAAPHIAGAAALLRHAGIPDPLSIKALLLNTTDHLYWDRALGWGYSNLARAYEHRQNVASRSLSWNRVVLLRGAVNGLFYASLAWNRYVFDPNTSTCLSDLDLELYDGGTGALLRASASAIDNVEKTYAEHRGTIVVTVGHGGTQCRSPEKFALASSIPLEPARVGLTAACSAPPAVAPGSRFAVNCTVRNTGDLPLFGIKGTLRWKGSSSGANQEFGTLRPAETGSGSWQVLAPNSAGTFTLQLDVGSSSFGAYISTTTELTVSTQGCQYAVSPPTIDVPASGSSITLSVTTQAECPWSAASNASWIMVISGGSGSGSGTVRLAVAANISGQPRMGNLTIAGQTVTITQAAAAVGLGLIVSPSQLQFSWTSGDRTPPPQVVEITSVGGGSVSWTASTNVSWIRIFPNSGTTPATLTVSAEPMGLVAGSHTGTITVRSQGQPDRLVTVTLLVTRPIPVISAIVNAASFQPGMVPGGLASLFGTNLSNVTGLELTGGALNWKGTSVRVEGRYVPLLAVAKRGGQEQINFQVPFELGTPAKVTVIVDNNGATAEARDVSLLRVQPGIFERLAGDLRRHAAAVKTDGSVVGPENPVARGDVVMLYLTGLGPVVPIVPTGVLGPRNPPAETWLRPTVLIGGVSAPVLFSGYAPDFLGLYQINALIPEGVAPGPAPLEVLIEGAQSQTSLIQIR